MQRPPALATVRRALAAPALRRLPLPRPAAAAQPVTPLIPAVDAARPLIPAVDAARPLARAPAAVAPPRHWYSVGGGSRIWTFDEVRRQVEANSRGAGAEGEGQKVVFVDVREPDELAATGKIPGAVCMPLKTAPQLVEHPGDDKIARRHGLQPAGLRDAHLVFYCRAGVRARTAAQLARGAGWPSVGEYPGSWLEWEERAGPVEKVPTE